MSKTIFIPDVHGDNNAFLDSLKNARCIETSSDDASIEIITDDILVLLGDLFERGPDNIAVAETVLELKKSMGDNLVYLIGNHEALMFRALLNRDPGAAAPWLCSDGITVLMEIAKRNKMILQKPSLQPFPVEMDETSFTRPIINFIHTQWKEAMQKRSAMHYDMAKAYQEAERLFTNEPYINLLDHMQMMHQSLVNVLEVHAFPDAYSARLGSMGCNERFKALKKDDLYDFDEDPLNESLWRKGTPAELLDRDTLEALKKKGVDLIIHGHDPQKDYIPHLEEHGGVSMLRLDTCMSGGMRKDGTSGWAYAEIDQQGQLFACSKDSNRMLLGLNQNGRFVAAKK